MEVLDARAPAEPPRPVGADPGELASALERLSRPHGAGELTDAGYTAAQQRLLGTSPGEGR
ncbi:hypothetical protein Drose_08505 [Dactylosporangium roseum]|uniref:SHOCT domain-containing protein n=1 Tax=Dactylosporangium roseum TaxID=47989 RepID=A0ABY5Z881_9ACTN|nr:hypothetical protein [Dactylosporangium roseum]UWZ38273.1 hypothetical protein Drose_08505 [Dactylosporangium roseum]